MALDHESTSASDHTSESSLVHPAQYTNSLAALMRSGRIGRVVVVGAGAAGLLTTEMLLGMAEHARAPLRVVLVDDGFYGPSVGSGGWFMPFANPDPRVERWSQDSFDMWDTVLTNAGLAAYRRRMPSLFVSNRRDGVPIPPGHPGHSSPIDPDVFDLRFWARGAYIDDGAVLSTCALMPTWRRRLAAHPSVVTVTNHLDGPDDISAIAESFSADVVIVTAGPRARFLLDDERVQGDFGVLLRGPLDRLPEMYKHIVIMDEDLDEELTYSIPHHQCGHVLFGGICGIDVDEAWEFEQIRAGNTDLTVAPDFARAAIDAVYARIHERMPALAPALPIDPTQPGAYWFGLRPRASRVITEWRPATGAPMLVIGGLGGSGFTIGPGVVLDALRLPLPPECQVRPGNTKAEEEE
jgi:glycine/D-amino acid oxidase-like deaminating enzyme